ncbi:MAG TPA: cation:proton antiporter [Dongiaceae bacterium]|nr:cation:proton antiporter [Dongiaceae bacterium]
MDGEYLGIFIDTLVILTAAVVGASLAERLKLGPMVGYLAAGLIIGPAFLDLIRDVHAPQALAELGIVFLLFTVGLELPVERLRQLPRAMFLLGGLQVAVTAAALTGIGVLFGLGVPASVALGAALSLSSTAIVLRLLAERRELHSRLGRGALGILMTQDLAVGPLLVLIPALRGTPLEMAEAVGISVIKAVAVTMLILGIGRIALRPLLNAVAASHSPEIFAALTLLLVLAAGAVTQTAGLSMAFGALLAGMLLANTAYRHQVAAEIEPFRGLLLGLFFMTVGMLLDTDLLPRHGPEILLMLTALLAVKGIIIFALAWRLFLPPAGSLRLGLLLAQGGEFAFVLFALTGKEGLLSPVLQQEMTIVVVLSMMATPLLALAGQRLAPRIAHRTEVTEDSVPRVPEGVLGHAIIAGYGRIGAAVAERMARAGISWVAVDSDPNNVNRARRAGLPVYYGDAARIEVMEALGLADAKAMVIAINDAERAVQLVALVHYVLPEMLILSRAFDEEHAAELRAAGANLTVPEPASIGDTMAESLLTALAPRAQPDEWFRSSP